MSTDVRAPNVPLFDRLCELDSTSLQASLQCDLQRLLNVRNGMTQAQFLRCEASVLHYGLPDLLTLSAQSEVDLQTLSDVVRHGICLFEPRLSGVTVRARRDPKRPGHALIAVSASATVGRERQRMDFAIDLGDQGGLMVPSA